MNWAKANGWSHNGFRLVVEWRESVFRFRVRRDDSTVIIAEGFARSLESAVEKAERAADALEPPMGLPPVS